MSNQIWSNSTTRYPTNLIKTTELDVNTITNYNDSDNVKFADIIKPSVTDTYDIGTSAKFWKDVYAQKYYIDDLNFSMQLNAGNPQIVFDAGGDGITYDRTANQLNFKIDGGSNELQLTDGTATFKSTINVQDNSTFISKSTAGATNNDVTIQFAANDVLYYDNSANTLTASIAAVDQFQIASTGVSSSELDPLADSTYNLGTAANKWKNVLLNEGTNNIHVSNIDFSNGGNNNTYIGNNINVVDTDSSYNVGVGSMALNELNTASTTTGGNVAVGYGSGRHITAGLNNVLVGSSTGSYLVNLTTGNYNTLLGDGASTSAIDSTEQISLGYRSATTVDYGVQLGQSGTATTTGIMKYREQILAEESWKADGLINDVYLDASGNYQQKFGTIGNVPQLTSSSTAVTLDAMIGTISSYTLTNVAGASVTFTVNNSYLVTGNERILLEPQVYSGTYTTNGLPVAQVNGIFIGQFQITIFNAHTTNALNGNMTLLFRVIR